jgi:NADH:ubiquinone oxidoreductase subunit
MSLAPVDIPRHKPSNPYNYTKVDLAKRKKALIDIERDFPNVPKMWAEWLYDTIENMPPEEVEKIINNGEWEKPSEKYQAKGGTIKCGEVLD